jgi:N-acylmannosamine kinase
VTDPSEGVLAVDIGGTKIAFAEVAGARLRNRRQIPTPRSGGDALVDAIAAEIRSARPSRLAVATTGIVSDGTLSALNPVTLPVEDHYPLAARLKSATGVSPLVVNDAQAAAWGEYRFGAGRGCRSFMFVTVSTGVGGGLVLDGCPQIGGMGLAGHVGHMTVPGEDRACGCGRRGCLETIASGTSIARRFGEDGGRPVSAPTVFEAASSGDTAANWILEDAALALAQAFANVIAATDIERIAIGGGIGLAQGFLERVCRHVAQLPTFFQRPVVAAQTGADAGMIGVADLALKKNFAIK